MPTSFQRPDLRILTPLRGIAALWVVVYHFGGQYLPALQPEQAGQLVGKGYLAVDLFFMLSGFVLTHVYHAEFARFDPGRYRDFLAARIARLYPLHVLVLFAFVTTAIAGRLFEFVQTGHFERLPLEGAHSMLALLANLVMLQGLDAGELSWNYPSWSISVEFLAYLVFPLAIGPIWRADRRRGMLLSLAANRGRVQALLDQPPLVKLGELSYAPYLIHGFVEHLTTRPPASGHGERIDPRRGAG